MVKHGALRASLASSLSTSNARSSNSQAYTLRKGGQERDRDGNCLDRSVMTVLAASICSRGGKGKAIVSMLDTNTAHSRAVAAVCGDSQGTN